MIKKRVKAYPSPSQARKPIPGWNPHQFLPSIPTTCKNCGFEGLYWSWNFRINKPCLVEGRMAHNCPTPNTRDVFPGWCDKCKAPDLIYLRKKDGLELTESYGLPHACEQDLVVEDMSSAKCRHCATPDMFWVKANNKYSLTCTDGTKHTCPSYIPYMKDWAEAKRMDYALEKVWLKSIPDGTECKKCQGKSYTTFLSKNKKTMRKYNCSEPIEMHRLCLHCKHIGTFTELRKKDYLKGLRKKYWPFVVGLHKWKKDIGT